MFITISLRFARQKYFMNQVLEYMYRVHPNAKGVKVGFFVMEFVSPNGVANRLFSGAKR